MELRHLRYFLAVMEELHFGRAAERLQMAQPPLSRAIRKLEEALGVQLLTRSSRAVTPTAAGRIFAEEARKVLGELDHAISAARHAGGATTVLRVGCMLHLRPDLLHQFLTCLEEHDRQITPQVIHMPTLEQLSRLRSGELDVAIGVDSGEHPDIDSAPLFPGEMLAAFIAASHPLAAHDVIHPDDVVEETLLIFPRAENPVFHDRFRAVIAGGGYHFHGIVEAPSLHARDLMVLAQQGRGVFLGIDHLRHETGADRVGVAVRPLDPGVQFPDTTISWLARAPEGPRRRIDAAREAARECYAGSA